MNIEHYCNDNDWEKLK